MMDGGVNPVLVSLLGNSGPDNRGLCGCSNGAQSALNGPNKWLEFVSNPSPLLCALLIPNGTAEDRSPAPDNRLL
jgi:hypothetical protein